MSVCVYSLVTRLPFVCGLFYLCVFPPDGTVRLAGGTESYEGRLEIFYRGQWGTVCDDGWTDSNTLVACRQLGYR